MYLTSAARVCMIAEIIMVTLHNFMSWHSWCRLWPQVRLLCTQKHTTTPISLGFCQGQILYLSHILVTFLVNGHRTYVHIVRALRHGAGRLVEVHHCISLGMTVNGTMGLLASKLAAVNWQSLDAAGWSNDCRTVPRVYLWQNCGHVNKLSNTA